MSVFRPSTGLLEKQVVVVVVHWEEKFTSQGCITYLIVFKPVLFIFRTTKRLKK